MKNFLGIKTIQNFSCFVFFILTTFSKEVLLAQTNGEDVTFSRIEVSSGLSNSTVTCILQDTKGFLWVGTRDGLNKFDGYNFKIYRNIENDTCSLLRNNITRIFEDVQKTIWVSTRGGGLHYYDDKLDRFVRLNEFSSDCQILQITEDDEKRVWITGATNSSAFVAQLDAKTRRLSKFFLPFKQPIVSILQESQNEFWIGVRKQGFFKWNKKTNTVQNYSSVASSSSPILDIVKIIKGKNNSLWIATYQGLKKFDISKNKLTNVTYDTSAPNDLALHPVLDIILDNDYLWVATENSGLSRVNTKTNQFTNFTFNKDYAFSLSDNTVWSVYKDRQGRIWAGTFSKGLCVIDRLQNKFSPLAISLRNDVVNSILKDHKNRIWIGTEGGLAVKDGINVKHYKHELGKENSLSNNPVLSIFEDSKKRIWIGTWAGGLDMYNERSDNFVRYQPDEYLNASNVFSIREWSKTKQILTSTYDGLSILVDESKPAFLKYKGDFEADNQIQKIFEDSEGNIWVGTVGGLNLFDPVKRKIIPLNSAPTGKKLITEMINCITEDSKKRVWVGSTEGLQLMLNKKVVRRYTSGDGLPSNVVTGILEDNHGHLWLGTTNGLSKFDPNQITFENYDINDGLISNEFKPNACFKSNDGQFYFGGKGVIVFNPDSIKRNPIIPPVYITDFKIFNKSIRIGENDSILKSQISETKELTLAHRYNFFSFDFVALNFSSSTKNEYAYKLEGFDKDWVYIQNRHTASFTGLDAGTYVFLVKASNNDGVWNESGASLIIHVLPPWWNTWWFRATVGLAIIGSILGFYKIRVAAIKKRSLLLEELVRERTLELKNERALILEINEKLQEANVEISAQNETIAIHNRQLDAMVEERTKDILQLNEKLIEYSFVNSHKIRGPLARVLGLVNLMKMNSGSNGTDRYEYLEYLDKLETSANELDCMIRELTIILSEETTGRIEFVKSIDTKTVL